MNAGDIIFQTMMFIFIFGIFGVAYFLVRSLLLKQPKRTNSIEQKLDKIIELLEKKNNE